MRFVDALPLAIVVSFPVYMFVRLMMGFWAGVRQEIRDQYKKEKEKRNAPPPDNQPDRKDDQRPE
jgi:F0F1-type ATP synthase assembly protein I